MSKKVSLLFMYLLIIIFLTGCWSKKELNELAIVAAMGIDKTKEGYLVTVQVVNPGELAGKQSTGRAKVIRYTATGETIFEAIRSLTLDSPREIYGAHLRVIVFGEELAIEGIGKTLDLLSRDHEMRSDFYLSIAKGAKAADILNVDTALEKVPATEIFNDIEIAMDRWGQTQTVNMDDLVSTLVSKGKDAVLPGVIVFGKPESGSSVKNTQDISPKTGLKLDSLGVFKQDKLLGWLNKNESIGYNYIADNISSTIVNVPCEDGIISINTIRSKTKVKGKMEKGVPKIDIEVTSEGEVGEVKCKADLSKPETIKELNKKYQEEIKKQVESAIKKVQEEYKSDIFGFGEVIHREDPKAWKRLETNWEQEFEKLDVSVQVNANIRRLGTISESFQKEIEE